MDKNEKELQDMVIRLIRANGHEKAPDGFTAQVLSKIGPVIVPPRKVMYRPLIPGFAWLLIALLTGILVAGLIGGHFPSDFASLGGIDPDRLNLPAFIPENGFLEVSSPIVYGTVALTFFAGLQITLIKRYLGSRQLPA